MRAAASQLAHAACLPPGPSLFEPQVCWLLAILISQHCQQVPGRVGDAAVPGGGSYAAPWGGCASTGDGDLHLRFQPCLLVRLVSGPAEGCLRHAACSTGPKLGVWCIGGCTLKSKRRLHLRGQPCLLVCCAECCLTAKPPVSWQSCRCLARMINLQLCWQAVEAVGQGKHPQEAADFAVRRIASFYPAYVGALVVASPEGQLGAACHGWRFQYTLLNSSLATNEPLVVHVAPLQTGSVPACSSTYSCMLSSGSEKGPSQLLESSSSTE